MGPGTSGTYLQKLVPPPGLNAKRSRKDPTIGDSVNGSLLGTSGETVGGEEPGHVSFVDQQDPENKVSQRYQLLNDDSSRMHKLKTSNASLFTIRESATNTNMTNNSS